MTAVPREHPEPVDRLAPGTGSGLSGILAVAVPRVREWAGPGLEALILSGSHATGEAAWAEHEGRKVSLSDLDLYAILRDEPAVREAGRRRASAPAAAGHDALREAGLIGPLEVAFLTRAGLTRMPARPGTVELARAGRVLLGDAAALAGLPRWSPADIGAEERLLLLENRAFELLWAHLTWGPGLAGLRARHAVLKTALELAASRTLLAGELPGPLAARATRAQALGPPPGIPPWLAGAWEAIEPALREALLARSEHARPVSGEAFRREWRTVVRAWSALWWSQAPGSTPGSDPWALATRAAARGSLPRRLRRALGPPPAGRAAGSAPSPEDAWPGGLGSRLAHALAGTPQLRVHGAAVVLLLAAAQSAGEPVLPLGALRALRRLGCPAPGSFMHAARLALSAWGRPLPAGPGPERPA